MIYYKNIILNISNSLNSRRVSNAYNYCSDLDAQVLAHECQVLHSVIARNGKSYYYFIEESLGTSIVQYLLNRNGVLAYRRYSGYQLFYGDLREVVRVPVDYVAKHPNANAFINKIIKEQSNPTPTADIDMPKYIETVRNSMRQK